MPRVLAAAIIAHQPEAFGFAAEPRDVPPPVESTVACTGPIRFEPARQGFIVATVQTTAIATTPAWPPAVPREPTPHAAAERAETRAANVTILEASGATRFDWALPVSM